MAKIINRGWKFRRRIYFPAPKRSMVIPVENLMTSQEEIDQATQCAAFKRRTARYHRKTERYIETEMARLKRRNKPKSPDLATEAGKKVDPK